MAVPIAIGTIQALGNDNLKQLVIGIFNNKELCMYWKKILVYQNCKSAFCSSLKTTFVLFLSILIYSNIYAMENERVWIYFIDKGNYQLSEIESEAKKHLSRKSIDRRAKKMTPIGYDFTDIPINQFYVKQLELSGIKIIHKSKWFNGVSAYVKKSDIPKIEGLQEKMEAGIQVPAPFLPVRRSRHEFRE